MKETLKPNQIVTELINSALNIIEDQQFVVTTKMFDKRNLKETKNLFLSLKTANDSCSSLTEFTSKIQRIDEFYAEQIQYTLLRLIRRLDPITEFKIPENSTKTLGRMFKKSQICFNEITTFIANFSLTSNSFNELRILLKNFSISFEKCSTYYYSRYFPEIIQSTRMETRSSSAKAEKEKSSSTDSKISKKYFHKSNFNANLQKVNSFVNNLELFSKLSEIFKLLITEIHTQSEENDHPSQENIPSSISLNTPLNEDDIENMNYENSPPVIEEIDPSILVKQLQLRPYETILHLQVENNLLKEKLSGMGNRPESIRKLKEERNNLLEENRNLKLELATLLDSNSDDQF